ncbi:MAG: hypothetical protein WBB22_07965 [Anaerolineae bacterium]
MTAFVLTCFFPRSRALGGETESEIGLRELRGSNLDRRLHLVSEEQAYRPHETTISGREHDGATRLVHRRVAGVRGLGNGGAAGRRVDVGLGLSPSGLGAEGVRSRVLHGEDGVVVAGEDRDVRTDWRVRPVVTGHTNLTDSERARLHTAYTDIEILQ